MCGDAGTDREGDPCDLVAKYFALPRMQPGPQVEAEFGGALDDRVRAADRAGRPIERSEEAVSGGVDFTPSEAGELPAHRLIV